MTGRDDRFDVRVRVAAGARDAIGRGRVIAVVDRAHDAVACASGKQDFSDVGRQTDDAARRRLQTDFGTAVVADRDIGPCGQCVGGQNDGKEAAHGKSSVLLRWAALTSTEGRANPGCATA
jgi:hypothetical protein